MDSLLQQLASGQLTPVTSLVWLAIAFVFSVAGGAGAGIVLAGKDLGMRLAATMGGLFGPTAAVPGTATGLLILHLL